MPSLHHGAVFVGVFLIVTGGSTAFLTSSQSRLQAFSLCCVVLGAVMLILGLFWAMNGKSRQGSYTNEYTHDYGHVLFSPRPGSHFPESQSVFLHRTLERQRRGLYSEDFDYPPMEPTCFSPAARGPPPHWEMEPPPPYEVAIKTTCSSTNMRRSYSDTLLPTEPLFSRSREISFKYKACFVSEPLGCTQSLQPPAGTEHGLPREPTFQVCFRNLILKLLTHH